MQKKYFPPQFKESKFHCILCGVFAQQRWSVLKYPDGNISEFMYSCCSHCDRFCFWYEGKMIVPSAAPVSPPHTDMPKECLTEYNEARDIVARSPRAASALLRLLIQKLMPILGEKGKNINDDISQLVSKGLPAQVQQALDYCRVIGNNAVHPGEINLNDTPDIATNLFSMINFIIDDRITRPKQIQALYSQLPDSARKAIEQRDSKNKDGTNA